MIVNELQTDKLKVNFETSKIAWIELQRFFAAGQVISVSNDLDLIEVAYQMSVDNHVFISSCLQNQSIAKVSDKQALKWFESNSEVWAVVVKPWVLVQGMCELD